MTCRARDFKHEAVAESGPGLGAESIERGRKVGFHDLVAKFDRQSLIAALKEQTADVIRAA